MKNKRLCLAGYSLAAAAAFGCSQSSKMVQPAPAIVQSSTEVQDKVALAWEADRSGESERALAMYREVLASDPNNAWSKRRIEQLSARSVQVATQGAEPANGTTSTVAKAPTSPAGRASFASERGSTTPAGAPVVAASREVPSSRNPFEDWAVESTEKKAPSAVAAADSKPSATEIADDAFAWAKEAAPKSADAASPSMPVAALAERHKKENRFDDEAVFDAIEQDTNPFASIVAESENSVGETAVADRSVPAPTEAAVAGNRDVPKERSAISIDRKISARADEMFAASDGQEKPAIRTVSFDQSTDMTDLVTNASPRLVDLCKDANAQILVLVDQLESPVADQRREALRKLALQGRKAQTARLPVRMLFDDPAPEVAAEAAWTLWQIEKDSFHAVRRLASLVRSKNKDAADMAVQSLGLIGPDAIAAAPMLRSQLNAVQGVRRVRLSEALLRIQPEDVGALQSLIESTRYGRPTERTEATFALTHAPTVHLPKVTPVLVNALHDEDEAVRTAAALTLGSFGHEANTARLALEAAAKYDTRSVRDAARASLACLPE